MSKPRRKTDGKMPEAIQRPDLGKAEATNILESEISNGAARGQGSDGPGGGLAFVSPMW
jgi:hypothetical protein